MNNRLVSGNTDDLKREYSPLSLEEVSRVGVHDLSSIDQGWGKSLECIPFCCNELHLKYLDKSLSYIVFFWDGLSV